MPLLNLPRRNLNKLIAQRRAWGADRFDEVWNGVYVMSPEADNTHQDLGWRLASALDSALGSSEEVATLHECNVSDHPDNWRKNYRCPDVALFLPGNPAENRESHWLGGPDFAVEIISRGDKSRKKFDFYATVNVRELMIVDRSPWRLELYCRSGSKRDAVGSSMLDDGQTLTSEVLGVTFKLISGPRRPRVEVTRLRDGQKWIA